MSEEEIRDILLDSSSISSIIIKENTSAYGSYYAFVVYCSLAIEAETVRLLIGIGEHWEQELFDFYIRDYAEFPFIPHVNKNGKICLYDLEGVLIDANLEGLLIQCINQARKIIEEGIAGENKEDFIKEFESYWCEQEKSYLAQICISHNEADYRLKYVKIEEDRKRRKGESYYSYLKRCNNIKIFASDDYSMFKRWGAKGPQRNGAYIDVYPAEFIYPPDPRRPVTLDFINNLLGMIESAEYTEAFGKLNSELCLVFFIHQPNGLETCVGVLIKQAVLESKGSKWTIVKNHRTELSPLRVNNVEKTHLMKRTEYEEGLHDKSCLLIGCGSIGSYLLDELVKCGIETITIVDADILKAENIYRHLLGAEYIGHYKTEALASYFKKNIPSARVNSCEVEIREAVEDGNIDFNDFDIIVSATGNHNINRWINGYMWEHCVKKTAFYVWNEPLDIGCHVAIISVGKQGCYDCFFQINEELGELCDTTAYTQPGQKVTKDLLGCGSSFIPYTSSISLKSAALCMEWIVKTVDHRNQQNVLVSMKGDGYYFGQVGLKVSGNYIRQVEMVEVKNGSEFCRKKCEVCGGRSHNPLE